MLYLFSDCVLDSDRRELHKGDVLVQVEPQVFDLIEYLIGTRERVASRDDLIEAVWKGRIVSESTLSSRINAARAAIGDDGIAQKLIRTLPRKGVRFVGDVREDRSDVAAATAATVDPPLAGQASPAATQVPTIAVLAFDNMSSDPDGLFFADGLTEEIITALARCSGIAVIARNSSFTFKGRATDVREVGRALGANFVLEGSVRRSGDTLRITTQLIDATSGRHLWADRFDCRMSNSFDVQDRVAESVVGVIEPRMRFAEVERRRQRSQSDGSSYGMWLNALALAGEFTQASLTEAISTLDRALERDPQSALLMATAAYYHAQCQFQGWIGDSAPKADTALKLAWDAVALDDRDANVQWMAAFAIWTFARDAQRARELFRRSLALNPNNALALTMAGWVENANGNAAAGREMIERSIHLNPRHPRAWFMYAGLAVSHIAEGRYADAATWAERALVQNRRSTVALRALAVALVMTGKVHDASPLVAELLQIEPDLTVAGLRQRLPFADDDLRRTYADSLLEAGLPAS